MNDEENKRVDESWKKQVEQDRESLTGGEPPDPDGPPSLGMLVSSLGMQAMMHLGLVEDPATKQAHLDLPHAQYVIDLLSVVEEKTRGNLTPEEDELLKGTLGELRMIFVKVAEAVREQQAKGKPPPIIRP